MLFKKTQLWRCIFLSSAFSAPAPSFAAELSLPDFPLQVTEYVEPNVMLLLDTSGSMATASGSAGQTRMDVIKEIATDLIEENKNIRFCLARFRFDQGGKILSECGSSNDAINSMKTAINGLTSGGSTPLAEAYYEVINYFAGSTPKYIGGAVGDRELPDDDPGNDTEPLTILNSSGKYTSPIEYRCQKNYAIVLTDGAPQLDSYFPGFPGPAAANKATNILSYYSNAIGPDGDYDKDGDDGSGGTLYYDNDGDDFQGSLGVYEYLDDMAKYAWDRDLRDSTEAGVDTDITGKSFNDTTNNNEYKVQNLSTYTVGFSLESEMLHKAGDYGKGGPGLVDYNGNGVFDDADAAANDHYFSAGNKAELKQAFTDAINQISDENQSVAEPTTNSDLFSGDLRLFQTRFTNTKWTGELISYKVDANTNKLVEYWVAPGSFPASWENRVVDAGINGGVPLKWGKLTTAQRNSWFGGNQDQHEQRLNYIRGKTAAQIDPVNYRKRESLMGDVVNSSPLYVGPPELSTFKYTDLETSHAGFVNTHDGTGTKRSSMIYVGANDGMLHGFDLSGNEKMAFVPSKVMPSLVELSSNDYSHLFYVDGAPSSADVFANFSGGSKSWKTVLVGGLRRGGQGIYALDITKPSRFKNGGNSVDNARASETLLWEFSDDETLGNANATDKYTADKDLGFTYSQPQIFRLNDGEFYVALGSGYNNTLADGNASLTGDAVLYLLNVATGEIEKKISTGYGMNEDPASGSLGNGLATVTGFDAGVLKDGQVSGKADGKVDYIYAGDLFGNVWKFDLSSENPSDWDYVAERKLDNSLNPDRNPIKLYTAKDADNKAQAITVQLQAHRLYDGEVMVYFGTGRLLEQADTQANTVINRSTNTFYAIVDDNTEISGRSALLEQTIDRQKSEGGQEFREVSGNIRTTEKGWYIDLQKPTYDSNDVLNYVKEGEQVIVTSRILDNVVYFVTRFADQDACLPPVRKDFLMTLGVRSGAALEYTIIDTDGNGVIDDNDNSTFGNNSSSSAISGRTGFGSQLPVIVDKGETVDGVKKKLICDATQCHELQSGAKEWNRTSWKEIRTD